MSASGISSETLARRWLERTLASYRAPLTAAAGGDEDPFRNPMAHTLREGLTTLARELLGGMDKAAIAPALDAVVRLRAVQDFSASAAVGFVFELRPLLCEEFGPVAEPLERRIDELALLAFDNYMNCREQIFELRAKELRLQAQYATR